MLREDHHTLTLLQLLNCIFKGRQNTGIVIHTNCTSVIEHTYSDRRDDVGKQLIAGMCPFRFLAPEIPEGIFRSHFFISNFKPENPKIF